MKKLLLVAMSVLSVLCSNAQDYYLHTHKNGNVVFEKKTSDIDSLSFQNSSVLFNYNNEQFSFPYSQIDSITFSTSQSVEVNDIYIIYNGSTVTVINPLDTSGVAITVYKQRKRL